MADIEIKIKLSSGKKVFLSEDEYNEMKGLFASNGNIVISYPSDNAYHWSYIDWERMFYVDYPSLPQYATCMA